MDENLSESALILMNTLYAGSPAGINGSGCQVADIVVAVASTGIGNLSITMFDSQVPGGAALLQSVLTDPMFLFGQGCVKKHLIISLQIQCVSEPYRVSVIL